MDMKTGNLSLELARWAAGLRYDDLPATAVHHVKRSLLDFLGVAIAGANMELARNVQAYLSETDGGGPAMVIGTNLTLSPSGATLANGTAASILELDDGHALATIHPGATSIPAVLAMAQVRGAPVRDVMLAIAIAYEAASRIGIAVCKTSAERGFHCTPLVGVLAATLGVSKILGSDAGRISHALGLAGSNAGGLFDYHGGWLNSWCINAGRAGREGLLSATLPGFGIAGPADIFDGPKGYGVAFAGGVHAMSGMLANLGEDWLMLHTAVKIYPCCRRLHPVIDAILALKRQAGADAGAVRRIVVETSEESARLNRTTFENLSAAQMSIPYGAAATLLFGEPKLEHFETEARRNPELLGLVERVEVRVAEDPAIADPTRLAARVSLSIGERTYSVPVTEPMGDPANPVGDQLLEEKFLGLAAPVVGEEAAKHLAAAIWNLDRQDTVSRDQGLRFMEYCRPEKESYKKR